MPIYSYRCENCGHTLDVLRKMSDPPLVDCPACGTANLRKQVTAAGFQLKGSGWYVTDFRNPASGKESSKEVARSSGSGDEQRTGGESETKASADKAAAGDSKAPSTTPAAEPTSASKGSSAAAGGTTPVATD